MKHKCVYNGIFPGFPAILEDQYNHRMHDGALGHRIKLIKQFLNYINIEVLEWSGCLSELNAIANAQTQRTRFNVNNFSASKP